LTARPISNGSDADSRHRVWVVKKRQISALLVLTSLVCLPLVFAACGRQDSEKATGASETVTVATVRRPPVAMVSVYVATTNIPKGTSGDSAAVGGQIKLERIPQEFKPQSAISSTHQLTGKVTLFDIPARSVIVANMFVAPTGPTESS
jgi:hypothetical protein